MPDTGPLTVLCIATYEKGHEFLRECKRQGCMTLLLTSETLKDGNWPRESIDETFYIPRNISREDLMKRVSHIARTYRLDRIVALDDFDVETAAMLREHLRVPGMGETTARYFRDKLAERQKARNAGILVPDFVHVVNDDEIRRFVERTPLPWMLKPRSQAAAIGMKKIENAEDLWPSIDALGDRRSFYLIERFVAGDIYHVDSIVWDREIVFQATHRYGQPPYQVAHGGGVFTTRSVPDTDPAWGALERINRDVLSTFGKGLPLHGRVFQGHVPVRLDEFEASLFFPLERLLIGVHPCRDGWIGRLEHRCRIPEHDLGREVPVRPAVSVELGLDAPDRQIPPGLHPFGQKRVVVLPEQLDELGVVPPLQPVEVPHCETLAAGRHLFLP